MVIRVATAVIKPARAPIDPENPLFDDISLIGKLFKVMSVANFEKKWNESNLI